MYDEIFNVQNIYILITKLQKLHDGLSVIPAEKSIFSLADINESIWAGNILNHYELLIYIYIYISMTIQYFHFQINQASLVLLVGVIWYFSLMINLYIR